MPSSPPSIVRFAVIGGGITGLTAAYRLSRLLPQAQVELFEASDRLGGVLDTRRTGELLIERGADSFLSTYPWAVELCREVGLADELMPTNPGHRRALVVRQGRCYPVPRGFVVSRPHRVLPLLRSPLLSWRGKLRLLREPWISSPAELPQTDYDESVASFATRRFGREAFEWLVQPLLAGVYTADPHKLSVAATMPEALDAERQYGSLLRATGRTPSSDHGARYASFVTLRHGLGQLTEKLASFLTPERLHFKSPIEQVEPVTGGQLTVRVVGGKTCGPFHGVVIAAPAPCAAELVEGFDSQLGSLLRKIPYASSAVVSLSVRREQIARLPDGFGLVVPTVENRPIVAASFSSVKFLGRAPDSQALVRVFLGGALQPRQLEQSDDALRAISVGQMRELLGLRGEPLEIEVVRWLEKMPQYHVGHVRLVRSIEERTAQHLGLELAGNAYHGVGIPQCIHSAEQAARRLFNKETES